MGFPDNKKERYNQSFGIHKGRVDNSHCRNAIPPNTLYTTSLYALYNDNNQNVNG